MWAELQMKHRNNFVQHTLYEVIRNGEIVVGKKRNSDIVFKISGEKGDSITNKNFRNNNNEDLQEYKVCNILWSLVKDTCSEKIIDFQEILNLLEEEEESEL